MQARPHGTPQAARFYWGVGRVDPVQELPLGEGYFNVRSM